jgi:hypothetical protein
MDFNVAIGFQPVFDQLLSAPARSSKASGACKTSRSDTGWKPMLPLRPVNFRTYS